MRTTTSETTSGTSAKTEGPLKDRARSIGTVETAKLIRKALRVAFPATKFSVRSDIYLMGSSIRVRWTDGPTSDQVDILVGPFGGGGFDGSIDLQYYTDRWLLPDGTATLARSTGTAGSHGSVPGFDYPRPHPQAELVHFGAHFVFASRETTLDPEQVGRDLCKLQGRDFVDNRQRGLMGAGDPHDLLEHVGRLIARTTIPARAVYAGVQRFEGSDPFAWCAICFE